MRNWVLIGTQEHWQIAFSHVPPIWGLTRRYFTTYSQMNAGDVLFFYATAPVKGLIGYGFLQEKVPAGTTAERNLIWPSEKEKGLPLWILRFTFAGKAIPPGKWERIAVKVMLSRYQTSILEFTGQEAFEYKKILDALPEILPLAQGVYEETKIVQPPPMIREFEPVLHNELKQKVFDIGQIQNYYSLLEYPLPHGGRIDVVWQYTKDGVPAFAFEVELSNNFEKAITRLKAAQLSWNTRPRLIVEAKYEQKLRELLSYEETRFRESLKLLFPEQLEDFYKIKQDFKEREKSLGFSD